MEQMFLELFKMSPVVGVLGLMYYYQRKDYSKLVEDTRVESKEREGKYQQMIDKITDKFAIVEEIKNDVDYIKDKISK